MSARDYFAVHAPDVPEWWPKDYELPRLSYPRELAKRVAEGFTNDKRDIEALARWFRDQDCELADYLQPLCRQMVRLREEEERARELARVRGELDRMIRWRWHYADQMLLARGDDGGAA